jgi:predicted enzyme related to lactoylglutathione lyase
VANADESAQTARTLGATIIAEPFDVLDVGRMALARDPLGATFALWQPRRHIGAHLVNEIGALCWNELVTSDGSRAAEFYTRLFRWKTKASSAVSGEYVEFLCGDSAIAGMVEFAGQSPALPPYWLPYFAVRNCRQTSSKARELGGEVRVASNRIPGVGEFSVLSDPQGALFAVLQLAAMTASGHA